MHQDAGWEARVETVTLPSGLSQEPPRTFLFGSGVGLRERGRRRPPESTNRSTIPRRCLPNAEARGSPAPPSFAGPRSRRPGWPFRALRARGPFPLFLGGKREYVGRIFSAEPVAVGPGSGVRNLPNRKGRIRRNLGTLPACQIALVDASLLEEVLPILESPGRDFLQELGVFSLGHFRSG